MGLILKFFTIFSLFISLFDYLDMVLGEGEALICLCDRGQLSRVYIWVLRIELKYSD